MENGKIVRAVNGNSNKGEGTSYGALLTSLFLTSFDPSLDFMAPPHVVFPFKAFQEAKGHSFSRLC